MGSSLQRWSRAAPGRAGPWGAEESAPELGSSSHDHHPAAEARGVRGLALPAGDPCPRKCSMSPTSHPPPLPKPRSLASPPRAPSWCLLLKTDWGRRGSLGHSHGSHRPQLSRASAGWSRSRVWAGLRPRPWTSGRAGDGKCDERAGGHSPFFLLSLAAAPRGPLFVQAAAGQEVSPSAPMRLFPAWPQPGQEGHGLLGAWLPGGPGPGEQLCLFGGGRAESVLTAAMAVCPRPAGSSTGVV